MDILNTLVHRFSSGKDYVSTAQMGVVGPRMINKIRQ